MAVGVLFGPCTGHLARHRGVLRGPQMTAFGPDNGSACGVGGFTGFTASLSF